MRHVLIAAALASLLPFGAALAETAPEPTSQSPLQKPLSNDGIPPCPTFAEQRAALGVKTASGTEMPAAQMGERSGIVPNAAGPGAEASAAPTVKSNGESVRSAFDCPLIPEHPNALPPGPQVAPQPSK